MRVHCETRVYQRRLRCARRGGMSRKEGLGGTCPPERPRPNWRPSLKPQSKSHRMGRSSSTIPLIYCVARKRRSRHRNRRARHGLQGHANKNSTQDGGVRVQQACRHYCMHFGAGGRRRSVPDASRVLLAWYVKGASCHTYGSKWALLWVSTQTTPTLAPGWCHEL